MACTLSPTPLAALPHLHPTTKTSSKPTIHRLTCSSNIPRSTRHPLARGRTLSTEAILAIQALKRSAPYGSRALSRLIKPDLLAALAELRRQGHHRLAATAFATLRREFSCRTDASLYAEMITLLDRCGMEREIDALVSDVMEEQDQWDHGEMGRVVKALIGVGRGGDARDVYRGMERGGCVPDESCFKVLIRGLRRLGEEEAADEVEEDLRRSIGGGVTLRMEPLGVR